MKINQTLFLQVASLDEEESKKQYKTRIADVSSENIAIEVPLDEKTGRLKRLDVGDQISAHFVTGDGVKNFFETEVIGHHTDVVRLVILRKPEPEAISRVQRRTFLRVPAALEIACRLGDHLQFLAMTEDISGGGTSIVCDGHIPIKANDTLSCWLLIHYRNGSIEHVPFKSEIIRTKPLETGKQLAMMRFQEIAGVEQQKIIRYCFERQFDMRK
ncbi:flagellar brake protein [Paenibacillus sp.]|uniref:flagellar brake protein n=1 Tax=Paenibacillus sp. TaxID=58172 RepID=UPI002D4D210E|nr:PilZ domain-containing protein [Paenibacillus sp.]HZG55457.1 PilZ domain-containing protein [Paenibacillus sp.]